MRRQLRRRRTKRRRSRLPVPLQVAYWRRFVPALRRLRAAHRSAARWARCISLPAINGTASRRAAIQRRQRRHLRRYGRARVRSDPLAERPGIRAAACGARLSAVAAGGGKRTGAVRAVRRQHGTGVARPAFSVWATSCRVEVFGTRDAGGLPFPMATGRRMRFPRRAAPPGGSIRRRVRGGATDGATAADAVAALAAAEQASSAK